MTSPRPLFASVRSSVLQAIVQRLDVSGHRAGLMLSRHGIPASVLDDPYGAVPLSAYLAFFDAAAREMQDADLGARLGMAIRAGDVGPVGLVLSLSASIDRGMARFARTTSALQHLGENAWLSEGETRVFSYRIPTGPDWPRRQDAEFSLVSLMQILRASFDTRLVPQAVHLEHPAPEDAGLLQRYFRCPVLFGQASNRLVLDAASTARIVRTEDDALIGALERHIRDLLGQDSAGQSATAQVSALIAASLGREGVGVAQLAARLGESPRTLQRRLQAEGTSVRALVEAERRAAVERLQAEGAGVGAMAQALGYADGTAFWRARRNWQAPPEGGEAGSSHHAGDQQHDHRKGDNQRDA